MILSLFLVFVAISLVLIIIGLARPSESSQAIIGFFILFLLSIIIIQGNVQYKTGYTEYMVYGNNFSGYHWDYRDPLEVSPNDDTQAYLFHVNRTYSYANFSDSPGASGFGYWLAIASAVGMAGVFYGLKKTKWSEE